MKKAALILIILSVTLCSTVCAKMPEVGDHVLVSVYLGEVSSMRYEGNISGISDGLICLNCSMAAANSRQVEADYPLNICIGAGQVQSLVWAK